MIINNIHTHDPEALDALISVEPWQFDPKPERFYSAGIHPWSTTRGDIEKQLEILATILNHPQVVALGEVGLDKLRGAPLKVQIDLLERQLALIADREPMPIIIHCVKAAQQLIPIRRKWGQQIGGEWIIHGFRQGPKAALMMLNEGFSLSFGQRYNIEAMAITPPERRYIETDDLPASFITQTASAITDHNHLNLKTEI